MRDQLLDKAGLAQMRDACVCLLCNQTVSPGVIVQPFGVPDVQQICLRVSKRTVFCPSLGAGLCLFLILACMYHPINIG